MLPAGGCRADGSCRHGTQDAKALALSAQGSQRELSAHLPGPHTPQGSGAVLLLHTWKLTHRPRHLPQDTGPPGGTASTGTRGRLTSKLVSSLTLPRTPTQEPLCPEGLWDPSAALLSPHAAATPSGRGHRMTCSWDHSHQATCHPSRSQKAQLPVRPREPQRLWGTHPHSGPISWGTK